MVKLHSYNGRDYNNHGKSYKYRPHINIIVSIFLFAFCLFLDLYTKHIVSSRAVNLNFGIVSISYTTNYGVSFGLFSYPYTYIIAIAISIILIFVILFAFYYHKIYRDMKLSLLASLFLAGIVGNVYDRLRFHYVRDFISLPFWPSFNIADTCISLSFIIFLYIIIRHHKRKL